MPDARYVLHHYSADASRWADLQAEAPRIPQAIAAHADHPTWGHLLADCFFLAWKPFPTARAVDDLAPAYRPHHPLVQGLLQDPAVAQLRASTQFQDWFSAVAALDLAERLTEHLPPPGPDATAAPPEDWRATGPLDEPTAPPPPDPGTGSIPRTVRAALHRALLHAQQEADETLAALRAWGSDPGALQTLSLGDRLEIGEQLRQHPTLRAVAEWLGRIRRAAHGWHSQRVDRVPEEIYSVTQGQDLSRALPQELVLLAHPTLRRLAQARFVEQRLLSYALRGRDRLAMGPVIVCVDVSSSTRGIIEIWEKAVASALVLEAAGTHRAARVILFAKAVPLVTIDFPTDQAPAARLQALIRVNTTWLGGGTSWDEPLQAGLAVLTTASWQAADLVLLTDGLCRLAPDTVAAVQTAQTQGLRMITVLVTEHPQSAPAVDHLTPWNTQILTVTPQLDPAAALVAAVTAPPRKAVAG